MRVFKQAALVVILAVLASIAPFAHSDGIYNPSANNVGNFEGIDSNKAAATCSAVIALDGTPVVVVGAAPAPTMTINLPTTTGTSDYVGIAIYNNTNSTTVTSVSGGGLTWTKRTNATITGNNVELWYATVTTTLAAPLITITFTQNVSFATVATFAFSGVNTSSPFDSNVSVPATTTTSTAPSISTSNANDVIIGVILDAANTGTAGAGFTAMTTTGFVVTEFKIVSATQSALSVGITGDTIQSGIADAVKRSC